MISGEAPNTNFRVVDMILMELIPRSTTLDATMLNSVLPQGCLKKIQAKYCTTPGMSKKITTIEIIE